MNGWATRKLAEARRTLQRCESSQGTGHNNRRMIRLREQIEKLERRIERLKAKQCTA
jgi:polyhydroxyalkanoate synthesis regulator phasin